MVGFVSELKMTGGMRHQLLSRSVIRKLVTVSPSTTTTTKAVNLTIEQQAGRQAGSRGVGRQAGRQGGRQAGQMQQLAGGTD